MPPSTLSVSLGLFTVALCHYLGVARLMLALSSTEPSSYTWMYPAFAKAIYLDASGCATHVPIGEAYDVHSRALILFDVRGCLVGLFSTADGLPVAAAGVVCFLCRFGAVAYIVLESKELALGNVHLHLALSQAGFAERESGRCAQACGLVAATRMHLRPTLALDSIHRLSAHDGFVLD